MIKCDKCFNGYYQFWFLLLSSVGVSSTSFQEVQSINQSINWLLVLFSACVRPWPESSELVGLYDLSGIIITIIVPYKALTTGIL